MKQKLEEIQSSQKVYETCKELNSYHLEDALELEGDSVEFLLERYRTYQTLLNSLDESESSLAKPDIEAIVDIYYTKILEIIAETGIDKKYGFGFAKGKPLEIDFLKHLTIPDTVESNYPRYVERMIAIRKQNKNSLNVGQHINIDDDLKGTESERIIAEELVQVPGVLATIDVPKLSIGDTRHKADIIAITVNPELRESVNEQELQLAIYKLIEKYKIIASEHISQHGENSLINPIDNTLGDTIKVSKDIHLDDITSEIKKGNIKLSNILQMHKIQIKTQASEMYRASESYSQSKNAIDSDKVGFLAREYHPSGDPQAEKFNRLHFQIAAQTVLGISIK